MFRLLTYALLALLLTVRCHSVCFETGLELRKAVNQYLQDNYPDTPLAKKYGWPIGKWCVSKVKDFRKIFENATAFNQDLSEWDTSSAETMSEMFMMASSFNQAIDSWNVTNVKDMSFMFFGALSFNQDLPSWRVSNARSMEGMFFGATAFDGAISEWDVANCVDMSSMFFGATSFNQDISQWNISGQIKMQDMFYGANAFRQNLCAWGSRLQGGTGGNLFKGTRCPNTLDPNWANPASGPLCNDCQTIAETSVLVLLHLIPYRLLLLLGAVSAAFVWKRRRHFIDPTDHNLDEFELLDLREQG